MPRGSIFIVDDEAGIRSTLRQILEDEGYAVEEAESGEQALPLAATEDFDVILLDVWLPGMDGLEVLTRLREQGVASEVLVISGHGNIETAVRATKLGAYDFIEKPLSLEKTLLVLRHAIEERRLARENSELLRQAEATVEIVGEAPVIVELRRRAALAAAGSGRVLVTGEHGTGK